MSSTTLFFLYLIVATIVSWAGIFGIYQFGISRIKNGELKVVWTGLCLLLMMYTPCGLIYVAAKYYLYHL